MALFGASVGADVAAASPAPLIAEVYCSGSENGLSSMHLVRNNEPLIVRFAKENLVFLANGGFAITGSIFNDVGFSSAVDQKALPANAVQSIIGLRSPSPAARTPRLCITTLFVSLFLVLIKIKKYVRR